jgi:hypothetical protein
MAAVGNREIQLGGDGNRENECRSNMKTGGEKKKEGKQDQEGLSDVLLRLIVNLGSFSGFSPVRGRRSFSARR